MRKKPDIIFLLSVLVVSGVLISNFAVIGKSDRKINNLSLLSAQYSQLQADSMTNVTKQKLKSQELAHIDLSKRQIR